VFQKTHIQVDIFDNWPEQIPLTVFNAIDKDAGNNSMITYSLDQNAGKSKFPEVKYLELTEFNLQNFPDFEIDPKTGIVQISNTLSGLARPEPYTIGVLAIDHGNPPQSAVAELHVTYNSITHKLPIFRFKFTKPAPL
jgi:hypothetical protein